MWVTIRPMESMWAHSITLGPLPRFRTIRFPRVSAATSSA